MPLLPLAHVVRLTVFCAVVMTAPLVAQDDKVATGPPRFPTSALPSVRLRGVGSDTSDLVAVRILGVVRQMDSLVVEAVGLDALGNAVPLAANGRTVSIRTTCRAEEPIVERTDVLPVSTADEGAVRTSAITIESTLQARGLAPSALLGLSRDLAVLPGDSLHISVFGEDIAVVSPLQNVVDAAASCRSYEETFTGNLSAALTALHRAMQWLPGDGREHDLVLVVAGDDQASVLHSVADVVERARNSRTRIHVIRRGLTMHGYIWRYIAGATGGRVTTLFDEDDDVSAAIVEILLGKHVAERMSAPLGTEVTTCDEVLVHVEVLTQGAILLDSAVIPLRDRSSRTGPTIVALFPDDTDASVRDSYTTLANLVDRMTDDPSLTIELIGHAGRDVTGKPEDVARRRAAMVADVLVAQGIDTTRIAIRSEGAMRPLYYFERDERQKLFNNRVEARIITDESTWSVQVTTSATEVKAAELVTTWSRKGYNAMYESVYGAKGPVYRIVLWGFTSRNEASKVARTTKGTVLP